MSFHSTIDNAWQGVSLLNGYATMMMRSLKSYTYI